MRGDGLVVAQHIKDDLEGLRSMELDVMGLQVVLDMELQQVVHQCMERVPMGLHYESMVC